MTDELAHRLGRVASCETDIHRARTKQKTEHMYEYFRLHARGPGLDLFIGSTGKVKGKVWITAEPAICHNSIYLPELCGRRLGGI